MAFLWFSFAACRALRKNLRRPGSGPGLDLTEWVMRVDSVLGSAYFPLLGGTTAQGRPLYLVLHFLLLQHRHFLAFFPV